MEEGVREGRRDWLQQRLGRAEKGRRKEDSCCCGCTSQHCQPDVSRGSEGKPQGAPRAHAPLNGGASGVFTEYKLDGCPDSVVQFLQRWNKLNLRIKRILSTLDVELDNAVMPNVGHLSGCSGAVLQMMWLSHMSSIMFCSPRLTLLL
eukprot:759469-Hanusia_phi.AAC.1